MSEFEQHLFNFLLQLKLFNNLDFLCKYVRLIYRNKDKERQKFRTHRHHVIPKCLQIESELSELKVNLLYSDHLLAHYYLFKASKNIEFKYKMLSSVIRLNAHFKENISEDNLTEEYIMNIRDYLQECYEYQSKVLLDNNPMYNEQTKLKHKKTMSQDEMRKRISNTLKLAYKEGRTHTPDQNKKISLKSLNNKWIHKNNIYKHVPENKLNEYLTQGWELGAKPRPESAIINTALKNYKKVIAVDQFDNEYQFTSVKEAAKWWYEEGNYPKRSEALDKYPYTLSDIIKKSASENKRIYGYQWIYVERGDVNE